MGTCRFFQRSHHAVVVPAEHVLQQPVQVLLQVFLWLQKQRMTSVLARRNSLESETKSNVNLCDWKCSNCMWFLKLQLSNSKNGERVGVKYQCVWAKCKSFNLFFPFVHIYFEMFPTILLEVLLVRSVPCKLGISSDMALSCCLSFANLSGKSEHSKRWGLLPKMPWRSSFSERQYLQTQITMQTLTGAASESSSCACKGLDAAPGTVCISSWRSSGRGRALAARCRACPRGPGRTW